LRELLGRSWRRISLSEGLLCREDFGRAPLSLLLGGTFTSLSLGLSTRRGPLSATTLLLRGGFREPLDFGPEGSAFTSLSMSIWKSRLLSMTSRTSLSPDAGRGDFGPLFVLRGVPLSLGFSLPMGTESSSRVKSTSSFFFGEDGFFAPGSANCSSG